ncbi:MAG: hypothetical protein AB7G11_02600 [Phycisphaerales bacterium]
MPPVTGPDPIRDWWDNALRVLWVVGVSVLVFAAVAVSMWALARAGGP